MGLFNTILGAVGSGLSAIPGPWAAVGNGLSSIASEYNAKEQLEAEQKFASAEAQKNRDFQTSERLASQEYNLEMWNLNNDYNSPVEQLKRAQAAGINPNSIFSSGNGGGFTPASPVTTSPMSGNGTASTGSIANGLLTHDAVTAQLLAQTRNIEADTANKEYELTWNQLSESERLDNLRKQNKKYDAEISKLVQDTELQQKFYELAARKNEEEIKVMQETLNKLRNESSAILKNIEYTDSQIKHTDALTAQVGKQTELTDEQITAQQIANDIEAVKRAFSDATGFALGTSDFDKMFKLWNEGKFTEITDLVLLKGQDSLNGVPVIGPLVNTLAGYGRNIGAQIEQLFLPKNYRNPTTIRRKKGQRGVGSTF